MDATRGDLANLACLAVGRLPAFGEDPAKLMYDSRCAVASVCFAHVFEAATGWAACHGDLIDFRRFCESQPSRFPGSLDANRTKEFILQHRRIPAPAGAFPADADVGAIEALLTRDGAERRARQNARLREMLGLRRMPADASEADDDVNRLSAAVREAPMLDKCPLTGASLDSREGVVLDGPAGADAHAVHRNCLLATRLARGPAAMVTGRAVRAAERAGRACVVDALLEAVAVRAAAFAPQGGGAPVVISDSEAFLAAERPFYFHPVLVPPVRREPGAVACWRRLLPALSPVFLMCDTAPFPLELPLSRGPGSSLHFSVFSGDPGPTDKAAAYTLVFDTVKGAVDAQASTGRICYFVPQFCGAERKHSEAKRYTFGLHESCAFVAGCVEGRGTASGLVEPGNAGGCRAYVNLLGSEGVLECVWGGGVAIVSCASDCEEAPAGCAGILRVNGPSEAIAAINKVCSGAILTTADNGDGCAPPATALYRRDVFLWAWKGLLSTRCPTRTGSPEDGHLLHSRFVLIGAAVGLASSAGAGRLMAPFDMPASECRGILIVENREDPGAALAAVVSAGNLPVGDRREMRRWRVVVACPDHAWPFYRSALACFGGALRRVRLSDAELPGRCFEIEAYNRLCKSSSFWDRVSEHCSAVLTVQGDGLLARRGIEAIPLFADLFSGGAGGAGGSGGKRLVEYAGAPWREHPWLVRRVGPDLVGNGGFSVRDVQACANACREAEASGKTAAIYTMAPHMSEPEDVFFSSRLRTASFDEAKRLSVEQVMCESAVGYHQFWRYHSVAATARHLEGLLAECAQCAAADGAALLDSGAGDNRIAISTAGNCGTAGSCGTAGRPRPCKIGHGVAVWDGGRRV